MTLTTGEDWAPYSVAILTFNEEVALPEAIASIPKGVEVTIVDSGSTDSTVELARAAGAEILENEFTGFGDQRNFVIANSGTSADWQLHLDADERMTAALDLAIRRFINTSGEMFDLASLPSKLILNDRWLRWGGAYPIYQARLVCRARGSFINFGHGQQEAPNSRAGFIEEPYRHEAFIHGLDRWIEKHNGYSRREVDRAHGQVALADLWSGSPVDRRRVFRELSRRLPFVSLVRFVYIYFIRFGFLDGREGLRYARLCAMYELMKAVKRRN